jgi:hypothetical protein
VRDSRPFIAWCKRAAVLVVIACSRSQEGRGPSITVSGSRDTIAVLDTVLFSAHLMPREATVVPIGWRWLPEQGSVDPWTKACSGSDTTCHIQVHGSGTMFFVARVGKVVDSGFAHVFANSAPDVGDEAGDSDNIGGYMAGCYHFDHPQFVGQYAKLRIDTMPVRLIGNSIGGKPGADGWELEPSAGAVGLDTAGGIRGDSTHHWLYAREHGSSSPHIEMIWRTGRDALRAKLLVDLRDYSLDGVLYAGPDSAAAVLDSVRITGQRTTCPK